MPEVAARAHVEALNPLLAEALEETGLDRLGDIDGVAVTVGPGLVGALLVGMAAAKAIASPPAHAAGRGQPPRGPITGRTSSRTGRPSRRTSRWSSAAATR